MKIFALVNKCLGVTALESSDDKGVYLNEAQLQALNDQLDAVDRANLDKQQAETVLNEATLALDAIDPTIATAATIAEKVTAIKTVLAAKPGKGAADPKGTQDTVMDSTNWDLINNLPHNKECDSFI